MGKPNFSDESKALLSLSKGVMRWPRSPSAGIR
jgi:hypothetical protein